MEVPTSLTLTDGYDLLDGGTVHVQGTTESGTSIGIHLNQYMFPEPKHPRRLLFAGDLVPVRSELESKVLQLLRNADIQIDDSPITDRVGRVIGSRPCPDLNRLRNSIIEFVSSSQYVEMAENGIPNVPPHKPWWQFWKGSSDNNVMHAKPGLRAGFSACKIIVPAR